jgi:hypothetical protein
MAATPVAHSKRAVTDAAGEFVLRAPAARVRLRVCHRGAEDEPSGAGSAGRPGVDWDDLDLAAAGATPLDLRLLPEGVVGGQIVDRDGRPVAGVRVEARSQMHMRRPLAGETTTDADGRFVLGGLGIWLPLSIQARTSTEAAAFEVKPDPDAPIVKTATLGPGGRLEVRLRGEDVAGCSPAYLSLLAPEFLDFAVVHLDAAGAARFPPMVPGRYLLMFECDLTRRVVDVRAGAPQVLACEVGNPTCTAVAP